MIAGSFFPLHCFLDFGHRSSLKVRNDTAYQTMILLLLITDLFCSCFSKTAKDHWFLLHSISNGYVVYLTYTDTVTAFMDPFAIGSAEDISIDASMFVLYLHLYHAIRYSVNRIDIIHHVVMMTLLLMPIVFDIDAHLHLSNVTLFFACGLPGGIDYFLMYLVEHDILKSITEKYINTLLNMWIRAPGIIYAAYLCFQYMLVVQIHIIPYLATSLVLLWNAQYFSHLVTESYALKTQSIILERLR